MTEQNQARLLILKILPEFPFDSASMDYHLGFDEHNQPTFSLKRNRLVRRSCGFRWIGAVHEYLEVYGRIFLFFCPSGKFFGPGGLAKPITEKREKTMSLLKIPDLNPLITLKWNEVIHLLLSSIAMEVVNPS